MLGRCDSNATPSATLCRKMLERLVSTDLYYVTYSLNSIEDIIVKFCEKILYNRSKADFVAQSACEEKQY